MKKECAKALAAVLAVTLIAASAAACGRSKKEPADSLVASETFVPATVQAVDDDELSALIKEIVGGDWDGDYSVLTQEQRQEIKKALAEKGYNATVTDNGIVYFAYTPTADKEEIVDAVRTALGDESWTGSFTDLSDEEKVAVRDELRSRGYDAEIKENGFQFLGEADRKEQTTGFFYNRMPTQEQIIGAVSDTIGSSGALKWDGNLNSLTDEQRKDVVKELNDYGFDLAVNEQGELYMAHNPANKTTYDTAYTPMEKDGTTLAPTTIAPATQENKPDEPTEPPENVTGTTADASVDAPNAERTVLSTFGGTGGDNFRHVTPSKDGGYIVTALFHSTDGDYAGTDTTWQGEKSAVVKYDKNGEFQWKATLGGKNIINRSGVNLLQATELTDGSIVAVGYTGARNLGATDMSDALMVCFDANGSQKWTKIFSGSEESDMFESVCATPDGGFLAGGRTKSSDGDFAGLLEESIKAVLVKFSAEGEKQWMQAFNSGTNASSFTSLAVTDAGYIYAACVAHNALHAQAQLDMLQFAGYGGRDSIVFKFDPNGTLLTHRAIAGSGNDELTSIALADGGVIVGGIFTENVRDDSVFAGKHNYGGGDAFLVRMDASLRVEWVKTFGGTGNDFITGVAQIKGGYAAVGYSTSSDNAFSFLGNGESDAFVLTVSENGTDVRKYALNGTGKEQANGIACRDGRQFAVVGSTGSANNHFSGLTPAPSGANVSFFGLYRVK